jgi:hypothetical protein
VLPVAAHATPAVTVAIGVDHAPPAGHDFEDTDFFPRSGTVVHQGEVLDFAWASSPDGLHTATVLAAGTSPSRPAASSRRSSATPTTGPGKTSPGFPAGEVMAAKLVQRCRVTRSVGVGRHCRRRRRATNFL